MKPRSNKIFAPLLALTSLHFFFDFTFAQQFSEIPNQIPVGTRPRSMGEAFVAVADDGHATFWNPAGMVRSEGLRMTFAYANLYGLGLKHNFLSVTYRLSDYLALGGFGTIIDAGETDFEYSREQFGISLALQSPQYLPVLRSLSLGLNAKYLQDTQTLKDPEIRASHPEGNYGGMGFDAGLLYTLDDIPFLPNGLSLGVMIHDLGDTKVTHRDTDFSEPIHSQTTRWGLSYRPFERWPWGNVPISEPLLAFDFDDRIHVGAEFLFAKTVAVRAGLQKDLHGEEQGSTLSFGVGFRRPLGSASRRLEVDYAYADTPVLPNTHTQIGGALVLDENPGLIRVEDAEMNEVFASLYKHYAFENGDSIEVSQIAALKAGELGRVVLKNLREDSLSVEVTFNAAPYTQNPVPQTVIVPGRGMKEVSLRAFLDESIVNAPTRERKTAKITATYSLPYRGEFATHKNVEYTLHGPGFLTWDDPVKAAAFVTKNDRCLNEFAKGVVTQEASGKYSAAFFSRNMNYALKIYEALNALNYRWVKDRTATPFSRVGKTKQVVDQIQYPADLLAGTSRAGDCDDLAVLYASLLESVGVETALLVTPTHLFMMLNTDIPARRLNSMLVAPEKFFAHRGTLWLPVETTLFPVAFAEAWHEGAMKAREAFIGDSLQIVEIGANQTPKGYEPADVSFACVTPGPNIVARAEANLAALADTASVYLAKFETDLRRNPGDLKRRNEYAAVLGQNGGRQKARLELMRVRAQDPTYAPSLNNLGNLAFIEGRYAEADSLYQQALRYNPYNKAGTYLNLALLYAMQIDTNDTRNKEWRKKYGEVLKDAGRWLGNDREQAALILGLTPLAAQGKGGKGEVERPKSSAGDSTRAAQDTSRYTPKDESDLSKKISKVWRFIGNAMQSLLEGREPDDMMLDWAGPKGRGIVDEDRARVLWWET